MAAPPDERLTIEVPPSPKQASVAESGVAEEATPLLLDGKGAVATPMEMEPEKEKGGSEQPRRRTQLLLAPVAAAAASGEDDQRACEN